MPYFLAFAVADILLHFMFRFVFLFPCRCLLLAVNWASARLGVPVDQQIFVLNQHFQWATSFAIMTPTWTAGTTIAPFSVIWLSGANTIPPWENWRKDGGIEAVVVRQSGLVLSWVSVLSLCSSSGRSMRRRRLSDSLQNVSWWYLRLGQYPSWLSFSGQSHRLISSGTGHIEGASASSSISDTFLVRMFSLAGITSMYTPFWGMSGTFNLERLTWEAEYENFRVLMVPSAPFFSYYS